MQRITVNRVLHRETSSHAHIHIGELQPHFSKLGFFLELGPRDGKWQIFCLGLSIDSLSTKRYLQRILKPNVT